MTITIKNELIGNKDIYDFIRVNVGKWLKEAKETYDKKSYTPINGWHYVSWKERAECKTKLTYWGLINSNIVAFLTYTGKTLYIKIEKEKK